MLELNIILKVIMIEKTKNIHEKKIPSQTHNQRLQENEDGRVDDSLVNEFIELRYSICVFVQITHIFIQKTLHFHDLFTARYYAYKEKNKNKKDKGGLYEDAYREEEEIELLVCRDSIKIRFADCYELTLSFLSNYLKQVFSITAVDAHELFQQCLEKGIITDDEAQNFIALSKCDEETDVPGEVIQYGIDIYNILKRLNLCDDY